MGPEGGAGEELWAQVQRLASGQGRRWVLESRGNGCDILSGC